MSCKDGTGCNCGETKIVSPEEARTSHAYRYSDMVVSAYGVAAYPPWREEEVPQISPWHIDTGTDIKIPGLTARPTNSCNDCKTVKVLRDLIEMLLKRIDTLEAKLEGKKKTSKSK